MEEGFGLDHNSLTDCVYLLIIKVFLARPDLLESNRCLLVNYDLYKSNLTQKYLTLGKFQNCGKMKSEILAAELKATKDRNLPLARSTFSHSLLFFYFSST